MLFIEYVLAREHYVRRVTISSIHRRSDKTKAKVILKLPAQFDEKL